MILCVVLVSFWVTPVGADSHAHMGDDPVLGKLMIDALEVREVEDGNPVKWDAEAWLGRDLRKLWLKSEGVRSDGETSAAELQLLYSRAVAPYWDLQAGWRGDLEPAPRRDWLAIGLRGTAPYFLEIDAALFAGESGRSALRVKMEYELRLTRRIILGPELEMNVYGKDDPALGVGAGVSSAQLGVRLYYQVARQFLPYVGVEGRRRFGATEDFARAGGLNPDDAWLLAGVRAWF
ncbi:MAG: copper resistance protein B [Gammaproteobacteria bacterium]|nr:copper resistance protein B [Gammaproteobacteria bacterium]